VRSARGGAGPGSGSRPPAGEEGTLAHVDYRGRARVGKYGVDLEQFERVAVPTLEDIPEGGVAVIDELGRMELASKPFRAAVGALFDKDAPVVATVHAHLHPFTDELKRRGDVEVVRVHGNRDALPERILAAPQRVQTFWLSRTDGRDQFPRARRSLR
jgi:nucleoside-triphosphatase